MNRLGSLLLVGIAAPAVAAGCASGRRQTESGATAEDLRAAVRWAEEQRREDQLTPAPALTRSEPPPEADSSEDVPGISIADWIRTATPPVAPPPAVESADTTAEASPAAEPKSSDPEPLPMSAAWGTSEEPAAETKSSAAAPVPDYPDHAAPDAAAEAAVAREQYDAAATLYGAGPGFTGVGAGPGFTGVGADQAAAEAYATLMYASPFRGPYAMILRVPLVRGR
jgi:hypothetical protein